VVIQAPPVPEERRFYQAILDQVFAPFRPSSSVEDLQHETLRMLVTINVKMLIIDEIHHVLAGPLLKQRHFLNVIKYMGNELQIPIVAAGTHDAFNAIQIDPQLANRFEPALLPRWSMNEDYLRLLASFEPTLRLEQPSNLMEPALATKILTLSGGSIGEISTLLTRAAVRAIDEGSERITNVTLDSCGYVAPSERRRVALGT
jgi:ATP-dependent Clp protease ATP-binding subunit ClpA